MRKMQANESINGMNVEQISSDLKSRGARLLVPKGVSGDMVRFVARDHAGNDVGAGMCFVADFGAINFSLWSV